MDHVDGLQSKRANVNQFVMKPTNFKIAFWHRILFAIVSVVRYNDENRMNTLFESISSRFAVLTHNSIKYKILTTRYVDKGT